MGIKSIKVSDKPLTGLDPKAAVPVILFTFVFCLVIDNGFKFMTKPIAEDLGLSLTTASLQATLAGIVIGIGAVVYAALADSISMRTLLVAGIAMIALGSAIGFAFQGVWELVLVGRIIQTCGLAAAETLYVIYVTKYLSKADQKTYLGFSTSAFQGALLIAAALILPALFVVQSVAVIVISMLLFPSGFALIYAPLVATVLWILAGIVLVGLAIWLVADGVLSRREAVRETVPA